MNELTLNKVYFHYKNEYYSIFIVKDFVRHDVIHKFICYEVIFLFQSDKNSYIKDRFYYRLYDNDSIVIEL